jgi:hypothetical protein
MNEIIKSIKPIIDNSSFVSIDDRAIDFFVDSITKEESEKSEFDNMPAIPNPSEENYIGLSIVYNSINFCYWGNPKWTVNIDGKNYDGSYGLMQAMIKGLKTGYNFLDPNYLANLASEDFSAALKGNTEISLFNERLNNLRKLGEIINQKFDGSWTNVLIKSKYDAIGIVNVLVNDFPEIYRDESLIDGNVIKFYKRAQLVSAYIDHDLYKTGAVSIKLSNINKLTAFADYKVPQVLRKLGILKYSQFLAQKVDNMILIEKDSYEEIEIRANTIEAIERATIKAKKRFPKINASRIDGIIWFRGQRKSPDDKPYHRTLTTAY